MRAFRSPTICAERLTKPVWASKLVGIGTSLLPEEHPNWQVKQVGGSRNGSTFANPHDIPAYIDRVYCICANIL